MRHATLPLALAAVLVAGALAFAPAVPEHARGGLGTDRAAAARTSGGGTGGGGGGGDVGTVHEADDLLAGCVDEVDATAPLSIEVEGEQADGALALPDGPPRALVVFTHGYGHSSHSWLGHLRWAAAELDAVALAMDYRGTLELPEDGKVGGTRGWQVREGAADSNAAARLVVAACPQIEQVVLFGVSMGANAAGLALAAQPTTPTGEPLYDWWINVEGAANVVETYLEARSLAASGNAFATNAVHDIEREVGGPIEDDPQGYVDLAVVSHVEEIVASGLRGVHHVHGVEDGLVPYDQARELHAGLAAASGRDLPQEFWTALRRDPAGPAPDEDQTNLSDYVVGAADPGWESPLVGHGSEASADNDVMWWSLGRLRALVVDGVELGCVEAIHDAGERIHLPTTACD